MWPSVGADRCFDAFVACSGPSSNFASSSNAPPPPNPVGSNLTQIRVDPYTVAPGQDATEVEPHMLANGATLVAFQTGRISPRGATAHWMNDFDRRWIDLEPWFFAGTDQRERTGPYDAASDPVLAYDAKQAVWMISSLPLSNAVEVPAAVVSRSLDGGFTWQAL